MSISEVTNIINSYYYFYFILIFIYKYKKIKN